MYKENLPNTCISGSGRKVSTNFLLIKSESQEEGFPHRKAMVATMNKLIRTLHALLTKDETYSI